MKLWLPLGVLIAISPGFAQQRGMYGGISTGRIVGSVTDPGFAGRLGATVSGLPQTSGSAINSPPIYGRPGVGGHVGGGGGIRGGRPRTAVVPFGVPVYYGGYGAGYGAGAYYDGVPATPPGQTIVQQVQPSPSVIINQYYTPETVRPQMKDYSDLPEANKQQDSDSPVKVYPPPSRTKPAEPAQAAKPPEDPKATITLLAFNDSSVMAAIGYWTQGDTLHYVTSNFAKKTAPVGTLDKTLSEQLNRERNVEFKLENLR